jgi:HSP20 family protein
MRGNDRDDPFDDVFREIERLMEDMMGNVRGEPDMGPSGRDPHSTTHVDVQEVEETVRVIADLPGVEKSDISLKCDGDTVMISATSATREYDERVSLPTPVDPETGSATYNNGVLEVTFEQSEKATDIDVE